MPHLHLILRLLLSKEIEPYFVNVMDEIECRWQLRRGGGGWKCCGVKSQSNILIFFATQFCIRNQNDIAK